LPAWASRPVLAVFGRAWRRFATARRFQPICRPPRTAASALHLLTFEKIITVCHLDSKNISNSGINHALVIALAQQGVRQHKDLEILFIN